MNREHDQNLFVKFAAYAAAGFLVLYSVYFVLLSDFSINARSIFGALLVSGLCAFLSTLLFKSILGLVQKPANLYVIFFALYYMMGVIGFSTYRGYVDSYYWFYIVIVSLLCFWLGGRLSEYFFSRRNHGQGHSGGAREVNGFFVGIIVFISFLSALFITIKHGVLFFNPEARFAVPAKLSYLVEFSLPVTLTVFCYGITRSGFTVNKMLLPAVVFLMLLSLGYRNQPVLLAMGVLVATFYCKKSEVSFNRFKNIFGLAVFLGLLFLGLSYLVRIENSVGRTLNWDYTIRYFDVVLPEFTLPFMPLHMAAREGMGVTTIALERIEDISSYVDRFWFFFLDFTTMLPDFSLTSGRVLGSIVNLNETSSLTPSLIGGLLISYSVAGVVVFFLLAGFLINYLWIKYKASHNPKYLSMFTVCLIYLFELTNRGIFKPMYIFAIIIVYFATASFKSKKT